MDIQPLKNLVRWSGWDWINILWIIQLENRIMHLWQLGIELGWISRHIPVWQQHWVQCREQRWMGTLVRDGAIVGPSRASVTAAVCQQQSWWAGVADFTFLPPPRLQWDKAVLGSWSRREGGSPGRGSCAGYLWKIDHRWSDNSDAQKKGERRQTWKSRLGWEVPGWLPPRSDSAIALHRLLLQPFLVPLPTSCHTIKCVMWSKAYSRML